MIHRLALVILAAIGSCMASCKPAQSPDPPTVAAAKQAEAADADKFALCTGVTGVEGKVAGEPVGLILLDEVKDCWAELQALLKDVIVTYQAEKAAAVVPPDAGTTSVVMTKVDAGP